MPSSSQQATAPQERRRQGDAAPQERRQDDPAPAPEPVVEPSAELITDVFARACPSRRTMENVASKWGMLALVALTEGAYRFNALRRRVDGVSEKMLAQTLHALERDGLISREVQATIPPRVEYALTPLGAPIAAQLRTLIELLEDGFPRIQAAQRRYDAGQ